MGSLFKLSDVHVIGHVTARGPFCRSKVMQTASGLPKKSLEERKVSSEGGRSKASGGKKVVQKKAKGGGGEVGQRAEGGEKRCSSAFSSAFVFKREPHARFTRITFFNHVFL